MAIRSTSTFTLVHPDFAPDSSWTFRTAKYDHDDAKISELTTKTIVGNVDRKAVKRALAEGRDITELVAQAVTQETRMSAKHALLQHMSAVEPGQALPWVGEEFRVPENFVYPGETAVDPHAGQIPPCEARYIGLHDSDLLDDIVRILNQVWAGRSPEEATSFLRGSERVDGPDDGLGAEGQVRPAPRTRRLSVVASDGSPPDGASRE